MTPRQWTTTLVVLSAFAALATPVPAEDEVPPESLIAAEVAALRTDLAGKHRALARWCRSKKLLRTGHAHLRMAFQLAPDLGSVRLDLGYKKVRGEWVLRKPPDLEKLRDKAPPAEAYVSRDSEIRQKRIRGLLRIARHAEELQLTEPARALRTRALRIDPENAEVRQALGHVEIGGRWFTPTEAAAIPKQIDIRKEAGPTPVAKAAGAPLVGYRAGRFLLDGRGTMEEFRFVLEAAARADGLYGLLLNGKPGPVMPVLLAVHPLGDRGLFVRYVTSLNLPPARLATAKQTGLLATRFSRVTAMPLAGNATFLADWVIHAAGIQALTGAGSRGHSWLKVGLTDYVSGRIAGTMLTRFFVVEQSSGVNMQEGKPGAAIRRLRLRNLALLGDDPRSGLIFSSALTGMSPEDGMKAWSLVAYLVERDPAAFARFARGVLQGDTAEALKAHFGLDPDGLDAAWREFVIEHG